MKKLTFWVVFALGLIGISGCVRLYEPAVIDELLYGQYIRDGWEAFSERNFDYALERFARALALDSLKGEAYAGLGWVYLMTQQYDYADYNFQRCAANPDTNYYGYAGWAFLMSALDSFTVSNTYLDSVLIHRPEWRFPYFPRLFTHHLWALKAHNYFLLSEFKASLKAIQEVNPQFQADVQTPDGLTRLAREIEQWLKEVDTTMPGIPRPDFVRFTGH